MIPRSTINAIREKTDLIALLESKGVSLQRAGTRYKGLCPVHNERSPSFIVNPDTQTYHCFGCGINGDAFSIIQELDGYSFTGAIEYLGDMAGIEVSNDAEEDPDYMRKKDYIRCVGQASWFYRKMFSGLPEEHPAKANLAGRNYLHVEGRETWLEDFGMGYAPAGYDMLSKFLIKQEFTEEQIIDAGLAFRSDKTNKLIDRFRNRLMWEIRDIQGKPIGFSGRRLNEEDNPKYLNTSQTILYNKSKVLYGIDLARKKIVDDKACFVVEGAADAMALAAVGVVNTVASCGTAFGSEHAAIIRRMIDDFDAQKNGKFIFVFDGDVAGVKAALRVFDISPSIRDRAYIVPIEKGDPVEFRVEYGDDALYDLLTNKQIPITEFMIRHAANNYNLQEVEDQQKFAHEALQIIAGITEIAIYESYKRKISLLSGIPMEHISRSGVKQQAPTLVEKPLYVQEYAPEPEYSPFEEEYPPDDGGSSESYIDPFGDVPSNAPTDTPYESIPTTHQPRALTTAEVNEKMILATLLQYPVLAYPTVKAKNNIFDLFTNSIYRDTLYEVHALIEYELTQGDNFKLKFSDFNNEKLIIELFNIIIDTPPERIESSMMRMINSIDKLSKKKHNQNLKAKIAQQMQLSDTSDFDLLAQMVNDRKK